MRRCFYALAVACAIVIGTDSFADKSNILVKEYSGVQVSLVTDPTGLQTVYDYQVNGQGDIALYYYTKNNLGLITDAGIHYTFQRKSGNPISGQIGPGTKVTDNFIPPGSISFEIVSLDRNYALVLFYTVLAEKKYMVFRLNNTYAIPTPNKTNPKTYAAASNEFCTMSNNQIISCFYTPNVVKSVTGRSRSSAMATLTTLTDHTLNTGDRITVMDVPEATYNLTEAEVLAVPDSKTFTYSCPGADEAFVASSGVLFRQENITSISVYNRNWNPQNTKGISSGGTSAKYGNLFPINVPIQKYYKGVAIDTAGPNQYMIYILKP